MFSMLVRRQASSHGSLAMLPRAPRREFHPGLIFLKQAGAAFKLMKLSASWGSVLTRSKFGQYKAFGVSSPETIADVWAKWMRRGAFASAGALVGGFAFVRTTAVEEIAVSGRKRLLLTTRREEIEIGNQASEELLQQYSREKQVLFVRDVDGSEPPAPPLSFYRVKRGLMWLKAQQQATVDKWLGTQEGRAWWESTPQGRTVLNAAWRIVKAVRSSQDLPDGVEQLQWRLHVIRTCADA